jgi:hypothetical protein
MDLDLREAFDQGFGPEPSHRSISERIEAGHRAVRRRRLAGTVVTAVAAAAVGLGAAVVVPGDSPEGASQVPGGESTATPPTTAPPEVAWQDGELARYTPEGAVQLREGVAMLQRIDAPLPPDVATRSVALSLQHDGQETWWLLQWDGPGSSASSSFHPGGAFATLADWVAEQVLLITHPEQVGKVDYISFAEDGSLVSSQGVRILEQRHPIHLANFAGPRDRTAAALVRGPDDTKWYVLVREVDGEVDVQRVDYRNGGADLDSFLAIAMDAFANGDGLR